MIKTALYLCLWLTIILPFTAGLGYKQLPIADFRAQTESVIDSTHLLFHSETLGEAKRPQHRFEPTHLRCYSR
jgi:hypothetical protein